MTNHLSGKFLILAIAILTLAGCASSPKSSGGRAGIIAKYTATPVIMDGKLDDKAWKNASVYQLGLAEKAYEKYPQSMRRSLSDELQERGEFKLLWNKEYLYVGIKYYDSDVVAEGMEDQMHHYAKGDTAEVFIKPVDETYYWELYVTPTNKKTCFFFPGRGRRSLPSCGESNMTLTTSADVKGSLNAWQDKDAYWTAEMAIPIKGLTQYGAKFGPGAQWDIFISRYNYSRYLSIKELSSYPIQKKANFHVLEDYGRIKLVK